MERPYLVSVYGAGGFTGRQVLAELKGARVPFVAAGRPSAALSEAAAEAGCTKVEVALDDTAGLVRHFSQARVVLACAGPFAHTGSALFDAALAAGTHLLDLSGEPAHLAHALSRSSEARERGIAVIHSVGFDVVPAELLASLCQQPLGPLDSLELATGHTAPIASLGTMRSWLASMQSKAPAGLSAVDGALIEEPLGAHKRVIDFPAPLGPRACASTSSAEVVLLARSIPTRRLRHYLATLAPKALAVAERRLPTWSMEEVQRAIAHLGERSQRGPDAAERGKSFFAIWCQATAGEDRRTMVMCGQNPYGVSAKLASWCALQAGQPAINLRGSYSPLQAFDRLHLLATLAHSGARWWGLPPHL